MIEPTRQPIERGTSHAKLQDHHLRRQAMVYVRQSHPQQVIDHVVFAERPLRKFERLLVCQLRAFPRS